MSNAKHRQKEQRDIALKQFNAGYSMIMHHPLFSHIAGEVSLIRDENGGYPKNGLAIVMKDGVVRCNPVARAEPAEWARAIAHCLLHLGMEHFAPHVRPAEWNMACDYVVERFLTDLRFGKPWYHGSLPLGVNDEERLYDRICEGFDKSEFLGLGTAGANVPDMVFAENRPGNSRYLYRNKPPQWANVFARGLSYAVTEAVQIASGAQGVGSRSASSKANQAKQWFLSHYPLLGAIAAGFKLIEETAVCQRMQVSIAAVSPSLSEIYLNPAAGLSKEELRFVMAHEFLHAALRHDIRKEWRDAYLWNVACDYVINGWLSEMGVGDRPDGLLYDEQFKGMNAEAIYDRIVTDMRTYRKLATLRGVGLGDILGGEAHGDGGARGECPDVDLDGFYRRALAQGLEYHKEQGRGYLPAGLVEEIRALAHPPIPWDVELARWFDQYFTPIEKVRSYARPSRRQSSTPDIPRPNWVVSKTALDGRTFGVVLDTSGSMERSMLASALGAIASYSAARDVPAARVVFCDAVAHDAGYMKPEDIAGTVKVKGRGGTVLQPGIDLLGKAEDFPQDAPVLVITDGICDRVVLCGRNHAFLIPHGASLPFSPKGKVFRMR